MAKKNRMKITYPDGTVIPGAKTVEQVEDNCGASDYGPVDSSHWKF